jgi:uncharacterized protein (DUF342 family)
VKQLVEKITVTASNVEQALAQAADQLQVPAAELAYSVKSEKKGLFGLKKTVEVEVWVTGDKAGQVVISAEGAERDLQVLWNSEEPPIDNPDQFQQIDGTIAVINGQLLVTGPQNGGKPAVLVPATAGFHIMVNGKTITGDMAVEVLEIDVIQVEPEVVPGWATLTIELAEDKMRAIGIVDLIAGQRYRLVDCDPCHKLTLPGIMEEVPPPGLTRDEINAKLAAANVVYGIDQGAVTHLLSAKHPTRVNLAEGVRGKPPVDETIEYLFTKKNERVADQDTIDYREKNNVVSVVAGEILAVKTPAQLGEKGMDVTGKAWEPPFPKVINIQAGKGVEVSADGMKLIAVQDGQPMVKMGVLAIIPVYQVKSVDLDSGNVRFNGSVIVQNNVEENMQVEAKEWVEVYSSVNMATVKAGGNITISKNAVGSKLQAGGESATSQALLKYLTQIPSLLEQMEAKSKAAREAMEKKGMAGKISDGYLIKIMLENMFPQLARTIKELADYVVQNNIDTDLEVAKVILLLQNSFQGLGPTQLDFNRVRQIKQVVLQIIGKLQQIALAMANVKIGYIQNSMVEASGDITITGKGGYNSELTAGGTVRFIGNPGVFRGGNILAGGNVELGELGSPAGALTTVTVPKNARIKAKKVYHNVIVKVGGFSEKIQEEITSYEAWVSERGLETTKLKGK